MPFCCIEFFIPAGNEEGEVPLRHTALDKRVAGDDVPKPSQERMDFLAALPAHMKHCVARTKNSV